MTQVYQALIVTIITIICVWDELNFGPIGLMAPLCSATLVGAFLGNLSLGLTIGSTLQMIFLGMVSVGASVPPDAIIGTTVSTALAILTNTGVETAVALCLPVAMLGQAVDIAVRTFASAFNPMANKAIEQENYKKLERINLLGFGVYALRGLIVFPAIYFGIDMVKAILAVIPEAILHGFEVAGGILPAVGFGLLLAMFTNKQLYAFYFIGFALAVYVNMSVMGVAIVAISTAVAIDFIMYHGEKEKPAKKASLDDLDDLMD